MKFPVIYELGKHSWSVLILRRVTVWGTLLKTLVLVIAVTDGSCLENISTLSNDALINDKLNITQPPAQLTKAYIILTVVSGWLSLPSSCCEIYGQTTTSKAVIVRKELFQRIYRFLQLVTPRSKITTSVLQNLRKAYLKDPEYLTTNPLLRVCLSVFVLLFGELDGLVRLEYYILLTFRGELCRYRKLNQSMNDSSNVIRLSRCQFKAVD